MDPSLNQTPPVVLLVFNRPELTRRAIEQVRLARPPVVLVVGDGPREGHPTDAARCVETRAVVEAALDWAPKKLFNYAERNLGLRQRVSSGLSWAFEQVESAIVLEDDCVAHPTFFQYCAELLERYRDDTRIGAISGDNFQPPGFQPLGSYYFSRYAHCWGWASWRRAWKFYDDSMLAWPELKGSGWLSNMFPNPAHARYWEEIFDRTHSRQANSWAFAWLFSCWSQSLLAILPEVNLVANIGAGDQATHTLTHDPLVHDKTACEIQFPLRHPRAMTRHFAADDYTQSHIYGLGGEGPKNGSGGLLSRFFGPRQRHG